MIPLALEGLRGGCKKPGRERQRGQCQLPTAEQIMCCAVLFVGQPATVTTPDSANHTRGAALKRRKAVPFSAADPLKLEVLDIFF